MRISRCLVAAAIIVASVSAHATTYEYSFTIQGAAITGSFEGTANGNLVTGLSNITAAIEGVAFADSGSLMQMSVNVAALGDPSASHWLYGVSTASFDGAQNNFRFYNASDDAVVVVSRSIYGSSNISAYTNGGLGSYFASTNPNPENWSLAAVSAVPEPETYALMLVGLAVVSTCVRRRQRVG